MFKNSPILKSFLYYLSALIVLYLSYKLLIGLEQMGVMDSRKNKAWALVPIAVYIGLGIALNISIMRRLMESGYLEYHQFTNTIDNIFRDKIQYMIFWIFKYPFLLLKIATIQRI
jgi:hypothetical protein